MFYTLVPKTEPVVADYNIDPVNADQPFKPEML
jgi:hypothetical protein